MATVREIAKAAGVSAAAVSRILNNDATLNVSQSTRERVISTAKSLGYEKPPRSTSGKAKFTLGLVLWFSAEQELKDSYYLRARHGIEDFCETNAIDIIRVFPGEPDIFQTLKGVGGIIALGKFSQTEIERFISICSNVVFLDMEVNKTNITSLSMDFESAVYSALNHLTSLGHIRISYLGGKEYVGDGQVLTDPRATAFRKYMEHRSLSYDGLFLEDKFNSQSGYDMMNALLASDNPPTAVFAASDAIAFGAMKAIRLAGLNIPEDISIIGFNDEEACEFVAPALTSIHAPAYDMGQHGANLIFVASNLRIHTPLRAKIPCELIIRSSTAAPKKI